MFTLTTLTLEQRTSQSITDCRMVEFLYDYKSESVFCNIKDEKQNILDNFFSSISNNMLQVTLRTWLNVYILLCHYFEAGGRSVLYSGWLAESAVLCEPLGGVQGLALGCYFAFHHFQPLENAHRKRQCCGRERLSLLSFTCVALVLLNWWFVFVLYVWLFFVWFYLFLAHAHWNISSHYHVRSVGGGLSQKSTLDRRNAKQHLSCMSVCTMSQLKWWFRGISLTPIVKASYIHWVKWV